MKTRRYVLSLFKTSSKAALISIIFTLVLPLYPQNKTISENPRFQRTERLKKETFKNVVKKKGRLTKEEWQTLIDQRWGEGVSTSEKLQIFDKYWDRIDQHYAGFPNLDIDWDAIKQRYRPEVEAGVSRGRFCAILNQISFLLYDGHSYVYDKDVYNDALEAGVPLLVIDGGLFNDHFGASLTPLQDSTLLVYKAVENHPMGLEPGDRVLGYEGRPWKELYKELLSYELPMTEMYFGSYRNSREHVLLTAAGENWHLFDTLDVIKYNTPDTLHLPTNLLEGQEMSLIGAEQLPVAGVPFPVFPDLITWGIVEGTDIGYIYTHSWNDGVHPDFKPEIYETAVLDLLHNHNTKGLILDARMNDGGQPQYYNNGLKHLFNKDLYFLDAVRRSDPDNHFGFSPANSNWRASYEYLGFKATTEIYDKPIAILSGPSAISAGDVYVLTARRHPYVRTFGKSTNGAFSGIDESVFDFSLGSDWYVLYPNHTLFLLENPGQYLTHFSQGVDEDIWLEADDVVNGEDTVVKRAIEWITNKVYPHSAKVDNTYYPAGTTGFNRVWVENPNAHNISVKTYLYTAQEVLIDSFAMNNVDSSLYESQFLLSDSIDDYYFDYKTTDLEDGDQQILPFAGHFTTKGPVQPADSFYINANYNATTRTQAIFLILQNMGTDKKVSDLNVNIKTADMRIEKMVYGTRNIPDLDPGEKYTSTVRDFFAFQYAEGYGPDSTAGNPIAFDVTVSSKGYPYWKSSMDFTVTAIAEQDIALPQEFVLMQNYPNPFNPKTNIEYRIPNSEFVNLSIYNLLGQKVVTLVDKKLPAGSYNIQWDASGFSSGIYIYTLETESGFRQSRKLLLLK